MPCGLACCGYLGFGGFAITKAVEQNVRPLRSQGLGNAEANAAGGAGD